MKGAKYKVRPFTKLLRCSYCGTRLTAHATNRIGKNWTGWYCRTRLSDPVHPRPAGMPDERVRELLQAEAAQMVAPAERVQIGRDATAELVELDAQRGRLVSALRSGVLTEQDVAADLGAIEAERDRLHAVEAAVDVPQEIDWSWEPDALNEVLHALWDSVVVELTSGTIEVTWRDPSLRRPDTSESEVRPAGG